MVEVIPKNYLIRIAPDLDRFIFSGNVKIQAETQKPVNQVTLDMVELAVWNCGVDLAGEAMDCPFEVDPNGEKLKIHLPQDVVGEIVLRIDFMGQINDRMVGFYRSHYRTQSAQGVIAVTQFEESDARRAFPCFDHPLKKATFDIEMVLDEGLVALSNSDIAEDEPLGDGRKRIRFHQTPRMSTYLVFFGVGSFEFVEDQEDIPVRVVTVPGMVKYAGYGLEFGRKALEFCEEAFGIKYPLPKLDLIAVPDFAFGAMENWGAVTFRENLLLHYPGVTSAAGRESICSVVAHEIVHQWFGNLVSPSDWSYLWLNESFATYFGHSVVNHYLPEWDTWDIFLHSQTATALQRDALNDTVSIEIPGGEHVVINASTAPIIYNKGGSVLRQIEAYMGEEAFRNGLREYLKKHAYDCASSHDLWEALGAVSERPISRIMKSWIEQPGYPVIEVSRENNQLVLTQRRFTYLPDGADQKWSIPVAIRLICGDGTSRRIQTLLESDSQRVDIDQDVIAYKVNDGHAGFYRVNYVQEENLRALGEGVLQKGLEAADRWGIENDLYALVMRGDRTVDDYLDFLNFYGNEDAFLPLISIGGHLHHAYCILEGPKRTEVAAIGVSILEGVLSGIGDEPAPAEKNATSILRDQIMWHSALFGSAQVERFALDAFSSLIRGEEIHPDIMRSVMQISAFKDPERAFGWLEKRFQSTESEHDRMNVLAALGSLSGTKSIENALQYVLEKVPDRNKFVPLGLMAGNPCAIPFLWDWFEAHLDQLERLHPVHYERIIASVVPICGLGREQHIKSFFEDYMRQKELAKDVIGLSLERLQINSLMRLRN